jgi:hypothetical protein
MTLLDNMTDAAYARWQASTPQWSKEAFRDQLTPQERVAVTVSNLVSQVRNGGFLQWFDNGYATQDSVAFLHRALHRMQGHNPATEKVLQLLAQFDDAVDLPEGPPTNEEDHLLLSEDLSDLDTDFYEVDTAFLQEVERYLEKGGW